MFLFFKAATMIFSCFLLFFAFVASIGVATAQVSLQPGGKVCHLSPSGGDDSDNLLKAFHQCGHDGKIIFAPEKFLINKVLKTTGLKNCQVDIGSATLVFSADIEYWLHNSIGVEFQSQSTAWLLGGQNVKILGGELDGNGQAWYDENQNQSNQPGRPIALTIFDSQHVLVDGLTFTQPQFWAAFVSHSFDVIMRNINVSAISHSQWNTVNTDGADTWNSDRIVLENWNVKSGDDCIAAKGNTTNLYVRNVTCHGGNGMTIGSVGQYPKTPDYVEHVLFEDITVTDAFNAAFIKTWQGVPVDNSTNGDAGGGGKGYVRNIEFRNFTITRVALPIQITQCIYSEARRTDCETSKIVISDITWKDFEGTTTFNIASSLHCAFGHPCSGIVFDNIKLESINSTLGLPNEGVDLQDEVYQCSNLIQPKGVPCNKEAPADFGQIVTGNIP